MINQELGPLPRRDDLYRHLLDQFNRGIAIYRACPGAKDFCFVDLNRAAEQISQHKREDLIGRNVATVFPNMRKNGLLQVFARVWSTGEAEHHPLIEFEEGNYKAWVDTYVYKLPSGEIVAVFDDITARMRTEHQLKEQDELLDRIINAFDHPFYVIHTATYGVEMANNAARALAGKRAITTCHALNHNKEKPCDEDGYPCPLQEVVRSRQPVAVEHIHLGANGSARSVEVRGYPLFNDQGDVTRMIEYTLDISERKLAGENAKAAAAAAEREQLARELHDAVSQNLFSAGLIAELLPELWEVDQEEARQSLLKLRQLIRATSAEMRTMLLELRPDSLVASPLIVLLDYLAETLINRTGVAVETDFSGDYNPPVDPKITIYRIVQESINNISRHAQASQVKLICHCVDDQLTIRIEDNGIGFDPQVIAHGHLGVAIMRERAQQIGAKLSISSLQGYGTKVVLLWSRAGETHD